MRKLNCWEVKKCGRAGASAAQGAVCPVFNEKELDGVHGGIRAGRVCWVVAGTFCHGHEQGTFASRYHDCELCDFFIRVKEEEGPAYQAPSVLQERIRKAYVRLMQIEQTITDKDL